MNKRNNHLKTRYAPSRNTAASTLRIGSDAKELQRANAPWDWCFVGAPEDHVHTPDELVDERDIASMLALYQVLLEEL